MATKRKAPEGSGANGKRKAVETPEADNDDGLLDVLGDNGLLEGENDEDAALQDALAGDGLGDELGDTLDGPALGLKLGTALVGPALGETVDGLALGLKLGSDVVGTPVGVLVGLAVGENVVPS